jgi:hypothetical protein
MVSALVWRLMRDKSEESEKLKKVLVKMSGKSQRRGVEPSAGTLLSGLFVVLTELLQNFIIICIKMGYNKIY